MLALLIVVGVIGAVCYWVGRGVSLNRALKQWAAVNDARERGVSEEALVNTRTGEVLEPGTPGYDRAARKAKVVFR